MTDPTNCATCGLPHERDGIQTCTSHHKPDEDGVIKPCLSWPKRHMRVCRFHGGNSPKARKAAEDRAATAELSRLAERGVLGMAQDVTPADAILTMVRVSAGHVAWYLDQLRQLAESELFWGVTEERESAGPVTADEVSESVRADEPPYVTRIRKAGPHVLLTAYEKERRFLLDCSAAALRVGVDIARIRLAERQGAALNEELNRLLRELGHEGDPVAERKVRDMLARLSPGSPAGLGEGGPGESVRR